MKKLTKIGLTALCGSLAVVASANAGELTVTGGVDMSWISKDSDTTGNPIGIGSNLTFTGSGELDNGWTVDLSVAHKNANIYSNTNVTVGVPGLGDFRISQGVSGSGICRMDDLTPNVWEEAWGTGLATGVDLVAGASGGAGVEWTPDMTPDGLTARVLWSPTVSGSGSSDKGYSGDDASHRGAGWDLTLEATSDITGIDGLTIWGGISSVEQRVDQSCISGDKDEQTVGIKYATGGFTLGYQISEEDTGRATGVTQYDNDAYGITFAVNDDLSIGYNHVESDEVSSTPVTAEADSLQAAYTMGGATFRIAEVDITNRNYGTTDHEGTVLSLGLSF